MSISSNSVVLQAVVSKDVASQVSEFAERFEVSDSRMVAIMLEACLSNERAFMRFASSAAVKKILRAFDAKKISLTITA